MELNKYSKTITQDETQPAAQAMLYGIPNWRRFKRKRK
jgi:dihydroxy-acid dehydratase